MFPSRERNNNIDILSDHRNFSHVQLGDASCSSQCDIRPSCRPHTILKVILEDRIRPSYNPHAYPYWKFTLPDFILPDFLQTGESMHPALSIFLTCDENMRQFGVAHEMYNLFH